MRDRTYLRVSTYFKYYLGDAIALERGEMSDYVVDRNAGRKGDS